MAASAQRTKQVFVAYPYNLFKKSDYRRAFKKVGDAFGVDFFFADEKIGNMQILRKIHRYIAVSDFRCLTFRAGIRMSLWSLASPTPSDGTIGIFCLTPKKMRRRMCRAISAGWTESNTTASPNWREKLTLLLEQWYPPDEQSPLDSFSEEMQAKVLRLLADKQERLGVVQIATELKTGKEMMQVIVRQLVDAGKIHREGERRGARYFLK